VGLAIGASQAGGVGFLDLEFHDSSAHDRQRRHLQTMLARLNSGQAMGVRCRAQDLERAETLLALLDGRPHYLIVHDDRPARLAAAGATNRRPSCLGLWVEVNDVQGVVSIASPESGVDAVIACGHECGGKVSTISSFLLAQRLLAGDFLPVMVRGVCGVRGAAACRAVGAAGVVLDHQTLLLPESPLPIGWQRLIESAHSQDFQMLGGQGQAPVTVLAHPAFPALGELQKAARALELEGAEAQQRFDATVDRLVRLGPPQDCLWPLGQTASWAAWTRDRYSSVGHLVKTVLEGSLAQVQSAAFSKPLAPGAPLAASHRTRYPIVQGPMTRVSDRPLFARAVADNGALPMVALALAKGPETRAVLEETAALLGEASWGVGILGFVPPQVLDIQLEEVRRVKPPFALIAGGRPRQALALEAEGIATYLHVPVPSLLASFIDQGARRFIFEGRECGGHVGPLSSFVLWEQSVETLLSKLPAGEKASILFAGGIHDARSAAMVCALAAPLVEAGMEIGVLMGTAYLFTEEAVQTGAISPAFQDVAVRCRRTVTLDSAVGQANRCAETPFARTFYEEKKRLLRQGASAETVHKELDDLLLGRLRQATRGTKRDKSGVMIAMDAKEQIADGMFMIGEVATLRSSVVSMEALHKEVSQAGAEQHQSAPAPTARGRRAPEPCDIAIVGLALHVPGAQEKETFWSRLLACRPALGEVPATRWDWRLYFDPDKHAPDRSYSRWGGWVDDFIFDPLSFGLPPNRWNSINSSQAISLELARQALDDAGYGTRSFPRHRTATVLASGDSGMFGGALLTRTMISLFAPGVPQSVLDKLPEWTEDSFPGVLASLCSGRVANRLDLGGSNFVVDAACASSLTAVDMGCHELVSGRADCAIVGGVDIGQTPFDFIGFSKVQALSPTGQVRPFDKRADGIVISEGAAFVVLKRLEDAQRDGDRVYAVIRAVGTSSDGRTMGLTAPCSAGQGRALESAWQLSGLDPASLDLYEAHATGTALGDVTELKTIVALLNKHSAQPQQCTIGSVKSLVGHTKRAAGLVSLAKTALALYHGVLPPHYGMEEPLEILSAPGTPVCLHTHAQPWFRRQGGQPRRAGVSAFGFGGTNAHLVLEEAPAARDASPGGEAWPVELILLEEQPGYPLEERLRELSRSLVDADVKLRDLAYSLALDLGKTPNAGLCAALVVESTEELREGLELLLRHLADPTHPLPNHIMVEQRLGTRIGKLAFLFPGQGSQYPSPARELALYFSEFREALQDADDRLAGCYPLPLTRLAYPPEPLNNEERERQRAALRDTHLAQPLLGSLSGGSFALMRRLGFAPDCLAGHSYGEFAALRAAQVMSPDDLLVLSEARGRAMANLGGPDAGSMAAISAQRSLVEEFLTPGGSVVVANHNSPGQTVIAGPTAALKEVLARLKEHGLRVVSLAVSGGFHSPVMAPAQSELVKTIRSLKLSSPQLPVYSNLNGRPYPVDPTAVVEQMQEHLLSSVEFVAQIQAMSQDGVLTFVEMAPGSVLSGLVKEILDLPDVVVTSMDQRGGGLSSFLKMLARLRLSGVSFSAEALYDGREVRRVEPLSLPKKKALAPTSWIVNSGFIRPASDPEPKLGKTVFETSQTRSEENVLVAPAATRVPTADVAVKPSAVPDPAPRVVVTPRSDRPANGLPPAAASSGATVPPLLSDSRVVEAYMAYQQTMQQFLRTQEKVMADFLHAVSASDLQQPYPSAQVQSLQPALAPIEAAPIKVAFSNGHHPAEEPVSATTTAETVETPTLVCDQPTIERELVRIVARRTGYPPEMLGLQSDLEGHLGIDSIKRLEIVEDLLTSLASGRAAELRDEAERLIRLRTLAELAQSLWSLLATPTAPESEPEAQQAQPAPRFLMRSRPAEPPDHAPAIGTYLILGSHDQLAAALVDRLRDLGCEAVVVSPDARESWKETLDPFVDISGVISLLGLEEHAFPSAAPELRQQIERQVKSLLWLLQTCGPHRLSRALMLITSRAGGQFGRSSSGSGSPLSAGALGLCRSLATEWPDARCVAVDFEDGLSQQRTLDILCQEFSSNDAEVGYWQGQRLVFEPVAAHLNTLDSARLEATSDWVLLATGGARGITAKLALAIAKPGMRVALAGRTLPPSADPSLAGLTTAEALRSHFISTQKGASPVEIERQVSSLLRAREVAQNLRAFEVMGCRVSYHAIDAADPQQLSSLVDTLYAEEGRIDAVFHGAGVIEDRLLEDKTEESFDRVIGTKVDTLLHLTASLRPETLKLFLLFSSVAGRFGNRGQSDYAAANEVLNRWAHELARRWPQTRVLSVNWGPWAGEGMAGVGHQKAFLARGIEPIAGPAGVAFLHLEMAAGEAGDVEVVAGAGDWSAILRATAAPAPTESHAR
jgi:acyl transferase domain-containing protein/NAD(P)-dependent dehydrogenase (short-subunit alcohol dehydrogenase family)/NAD(P)H-dependent flavin oxidoreductase YrpB (nitropropane dioxygenase family)